MAEPIKLDELLSSKIICLDQNFCHLNRKITPICGKIFIFLSCYSFVVFVLSHFPLNIQFFTDMHICVDDDMMEIALQITFLIRT